jgi:hypothetical protein
MTINKRRAGVLVGGVGAVAALAALTVSGTSALYSSKIGPQENKIVSGTNVLTENGAVQNTLNVTDLMPGDTKVSDYKMKYAGQPAFVGIDLTVKSIAAKACTVPGVAGTALLSQAQLASCTDTGTQPMYNGVADSGSFDLSVAPANLNGAVFVGLVQNQMLGNTTKCSADAAGLISCIADLKNILSVPGYYTNSADTFIWKNNDDTNIQITNTLPLKAPNAFQGSKVQIDVSAHAVQAANNAGTFAQRAAGTSTPQAANATDPNGNAGSLVTWPKSWS